VLTQRFEARLEPSHDNIMHDTGYHHAAGISETFQTGGNVDAVSIDRAVGFFDHVAQVDADPEQHLAMLEQLCIAVRQRRLDPHGRFSGADGRLKHRQHRIASHIHDAALMRDNMVSKDLPGGVQGGDGGLCIVLHQTRIPVNIRHQYGREPLCDLRFRHPCCPPKPGNGSSLTGNGTTPNPSVQSVCSTGWPLWCGAPSAPGTFRAHHINTLCQSPSPPNAL
jgi:hypothetical protein